MSMPSSSAFVETTPEHPALAQAPLDLAPLERQVAAAVAADDALGSRLRLERLLQVRDENLGREPRRGEDDRLQALAEERERDVAGRVEGRSPDAELPVHDRRVVDREVAVAPRRAAAVDERHLPLGEDLGQLLRVADRGRGADELRPRAVELAQPPQPPEDVGHVRAEHAAQAVQLVDHDVAEVLEQLHPLRVVRQDALVEHVGVRDHDVRPRPDRLARVLRRVAVVRERPDVGARSTRSCRAAPPAGPGRAPSSGRGTGRGRRGPSGRGRGPAGCSRASCRRPWG